MCESYVSFFLSLFFLFGDGNVSVELALSIAPLVTGRSTVLTMTGFFYSIVASVLTMLFIWVCRLFFSRGTDRRTPKLAHLG